MEPINIMDGVWVFTSALYQTTSTVIRTPEAIIVVDPNWLPAEVSAIRTFVDSISSSQTCHWLFTHADYDHILGHGAFQADHVIASKAFAESNHKDADVAEAIQSDTDRGFIRDYAVRYPEADIIISGDGQQLTVGDMTLTCYLAPGHTPEGMFTVIEPHGILIAGDYLSDVEFPLVKNNTAYRTTLDKVRYIIETHKIRHLIPGHGTVTSDQDNMLQRVSEANAYLDDLEAAARGLTFPEETYASRYPAWGELKEWHLENLRLFRGTSQ